MRDVRREARNEIAKLWLTVSAVVLSVFAVVIGSTVLGAWIGLSVQVVGFIWCGVMLIGVVVFFSWLAYDDYVFWNERDS